MKSGYTYIDTNIFGILACKPHLLDPIAQFLNDKHQKVVLSEIQALELSEYVEKISVEFIQILKALPVIISKPAIILYEEEIKSYPNERNLPLEHPILNTHPEFYFSLLLKSEKLKLHRKNQKQDAQKVESMVKQYKPNFKIDKNKTLESQAELFAHHITIQHLTKHYPKETLTIWKKYNKIDVKVFKTNQIQGLVNFYRYYIDNEKPNSHDHADSWHLSYLPYCQYAIIEQRLCSILNRIQKNNKRFTNITVRDNRWLEKELLQLY